MKILILTNLENPCGITDHSLSLQAGLQSIGHVCDLYQIPIQKLKTLDLKKSHELFKEFSDRAKAYDSLFIQHEHGLYNGAFDYRKSIHIFERLLKDVLCLKKPTILFFHSPKFYQKRFGLRAALDTLSNINRSWRRLVRHINTASVCHCFTHSQFGKETLAQYGLSLNKVTDCYHPVPTNIYRTQKVNKLAAQLSSDNPQMTVGIFGFVAGYKGYDTAIRALCHLPDWITLKIVGGRHPYDTEDRTFENLQSLANPANRKSSLSSMNRYGSSPVFFGIPSADIDTRQIGKRIEITGVLPEEKIDKTLAELDVIWAPYHIGAPLGSAALSRAMASGRPIISSSNESFLEFEKKFGCIKTFGEHAPGELARVTMDLLNSAQTEESLVEKSRLFCDKNNWQDLCETISEQLLHFAKVQSEFNLYWEKAGTSLISLKRTVSVSFVSELTDK